LRTGASDTAVARLQLPPQNKLQLIDFRQHLAVDHRIQLPFVIPVPRIEILCALSEILDFPGHIFIVAGRTAQPSDIAHQVAVGSVRIRRGRLIGQIAHAPVFINRPVTVASRPVIITVTAARRTTSSTRAQTTLHVAALLAATLLITSLLTTALLSTLLLTACLLTTLLLAASLLTTLLLTTRLTALLALTLTSLLLPALLATLLPALALLPRFLPLLLAARSALIARTAKLLDFPPHPLRLAQRLLHSDLTLVIARISTARLTGFRFQFLQIVLQLIQRLRYWSFMQNGVLTHPLLQG
jgi:hypothetical protein